MRRSMLLPLLALIAIGAGIGAGGAGADASVPAKRVAAGSAPGARIKVIDSEFGRVIADRKGEALYLFEKERGRKAKCYGTCASVWPPVLTKGKPRAGTGADASLLGTTKRANGKLQVTYAGNPLYRYVGDSPGSILCHDVFEFGGSWLVVEPSGDAAD